MIALDPLRPDVEARWRALALPDEELHLVARSDMDHRGRFGERWLIITNQRLVVLPNADPQEDGLLALPLATMSGARTEPLVGGGRLEVQVKGRWVPVLEYSSSLGNKLTEVARGLQQLAKGEPLAISTDLPRLRCEKCGTLLPDKNGLCPRCVRKLAVLLRIMSYLRPFWPMALLLAGLTFGRALVQLMPPLLTKYMIDNVLIPRENFPLLVWLVGGLVAAAIVTGVLQVAGGWVGAWLSTRVITAIRAELFRALERQSLAFFNRREQGALMSLVMNDSGNLNYFLLDGLPYLVVNAVMLFGILAILLGINWQLTLAIMIPAPIVVIGGGLLWRRMRTLWHRLAQSWAIFSAHLNEALSGVRVTKAFAQESMEIVRFDRRNQDLARATIREARTWETSFAALNFFTSSGAFIAWLVGGRAVIQGTLTLGTLTAFVQYLWLLYGPLQWFNQIYNWMSRALAGAERIFEVIDAPPEPFAHPGARRIVPLRGEVEFRNVTFGYDKTKPVLKEVSLHVHPGEMIGLVGKSGAGKSTLTNLVCRFYEADHGQVLIDGHDIRDIELTSLRDQIGVVLQEPFLFSGTIMENIRYAKPEAALAEVIAAAKAANAHDFIVGKPEGYDTLVGERGNKLSTGEKQRVSIARAILKDPRILILDEATSSVDTETEKAIQEALARLVKGRTVFAIAHRLSTLRNCHRLVVLEDGKVAEVGTHEELMAMRGIYYRLLEMQRELSQVKTVDG